MAKAIAVLKVIARVLGLSALIGGIGAAFVGVILAIVGILKISGILFSAFFTLITAIPVYFLWNWLMPDLFGLPLLGYWQAWGITFLATLLFKGGGKIILNRPKNKS